MGTRGAVAVGTLESWRGVYCHSDSYPTWLGKHLYEHLQAELGSGRTLAEIGEDILHFDDWRNYLKGGVCEYCGQMRSQPHAFSYMPVRSDGEFPDPEVKYHRHDPVADLRELQYTQKNVEGSSLEWVYVIDAQASAVHVLRVRGSSRYVGDMTFDAVPNFGVLECGEHFERCIHYAWYHLPEIDKDGSEGRLSMLDYVAIHGSSSHP